MSNWISTTVGNLATYVNGRGFKPVEWTTQGLPIVRIANLNNPSAPYDYFTGTLNGGHHINNNDIVVSWSATLDVFIWERGPAALNQHIFKVVPNEAVVDREFLFFVLKEAMHGLSELVHGATMKHVTRPEFEGFQVRIPSKKADQRRIAARLKAQLAEVEKARRAVEEQITASEDLAVAYLHEIFGGDNAEKWPIVTLGEAGEVVSGITLGRKTNCKELREVPYLRVANVKDGHLDLSEIKTVKATEAEIRKWTLQPGDILLTEGGDPDKLGRGTFWAGELPECIHQNHIYRVRFPKDKYMPEFIAAQIGSNYGKSYFFAHAKKTTGIATINQQVLKAFALLSPPLEMQQAIMKTLSEKLQEAQSILSGIKQIADDIESLPKRLLSQAFES